MKKIDMDALLTDARVEAEAWRDNRETARREMYEALLVHVKGFKYLTGTQEPTADTPGFLTFSVGSQYRIRVECNIKNYYLYGQRCPKNSEATKHWDGGRSELDVEQVCKGIAQSIAEELSKNSAPEVA